MAAPITGFPAPQHAYQLDRPLTLEEEATTYTTLMNLARRKISGVAQKLSQTLMVTIDGLVEEEMVLDAVGLIKKMGSQEERLYRHRCVEAWQWRYPGQLRWLN